jgi:hypothetical protein
VNVWLDENIVNQTDDNTWQDIRALVHRARGQLPGVNHSVTQIPDIGLRGQPDPEVFRQAGKPGKDRCDVFFTQDVRILSEHQNAIPTDMAVVAIYDPFNHPPLTMKDLLRSHPEVIEHALVNYRRGMRLVIMPNHPSCDIHLGRTLYQGLPSPSGRPLTSGAAQQIVSSKPDKHHILQCSSDGTEFHIYYAQQASNHSTIPPSEQLRNQREFPCREIPGLTTMHYTPQVGY